jgi:hypothetical protein
MTPQPVRVPSMRLVLGKHSGRHALALRCEALGFRLDHRELDQIYRQLLILADNSKIIEDRQVLELIKRHTKSTRLSTPVLYRWLLPRVKARSARCIHRKRRTAGMASWAASELEVEQQEDYLWGV